MSIFAIKSFKSNFLLPSKFDNILLFSQQLNILSSDTITAKKMFDTCIHVLNYKVKHVSEILFEYYLELYFLLISILFII